MTSTINANVILVGFMGTGKTTVGKLLAQQLKKSFIDMDSIIEERAGKSIGQIFEEDGEPRFREMERALVQELAAKTGLVIAAGGGIVLNPDNISDFNRSGKIICLLASGDEILRRVAGSTARPLLEKGDKHQRILALMEKRRPLYEAIPCRVNTSGLTPREVAEIIMLMVNAEGGR
ncbi:MAG: shikimate kinase [Kiritimatiellia bacterium]|nr:shikimate kinase [Kiritimatiellia bacterium]